MLDENNFVYGPNERCKSATLNAKVVNDKGASDTVSGNV